MRAEYLRRAVELTNSLGRTWWPWPAITSAAGPVGGRLTATLSVLRPPLGTLAVLGNHDHHHGAAAVDRPCSPPAPSS